MMKSLAVLLLVLVGLFATHAASALEPHTRYAIVVSRATAADAGWAKVVAALQDKHRPLGATKLLAYDKTAADVLPQLRADIPRYVCFVATPAEAGRQFVADVHRLMRKLDDDPYTDACWGILTGYDAENALAIASTKEPLTVKRVASGTEVALDRVVEGMWYCELQKNRYVHKDAGGEAVQDKGPNDTTEALAKALSERADLFVTSGHATERDWQIGYAYRNGSFRSKAGELFGVDTTGKKIPIHSDTPKVYLPIGNCLMGHVDGPDAMALAFMKSAGVRQMIGYTVLTWYGYAGWGCLDYYVEQPGRYTFNEAFLANECALVHRLETNFPEIARLDVPPGGTPRVAVKLSEAAKAAGLTQQDALGTLHDRDVLAFYGDPAWEARMAKGKLAYDQTLEQKGNEFVFEIKPLEGDKSFDTVNKNGAQRGGRPIVQFFDEQLTDIKVTGGDDLKPVITDTFILVPHPGKCDPARTYRVTFTATVVR
jgi:zinc protease